MFQIIGTTFLELRQVLCHRCPTRATAVTRVTQQEDEMNTAGGQWKGAHNKSFQPRWTNLTSCLEQLKISEIFKAMILRYWTIGSAERWSWDRGNEWDEPYGWPSLLHREVAFTLSWDSQRSLHSLGQPGHRMHIIWTTVDTAKQFCEEVVQRYTPCRMHESIFSF